MLASYTYDENQNLKALDYGNGDRVEYTYNKQGQVTKQTYEDGTTITYAYDNSGALATVTDSATGRKTTYYYDLLDRMMKYVETGKEYSHSVEYTYDERNNMSKIVEVINGVQRDVQYAYDEDNRLESLISGETEKSSTYDDFGRVNQQQTKHGENTVKTDSYTFTEPSAGTTSGQIGQHTIQSQTGDLNKTYSYTYDDNGNITAINDGTNTVTYVYDSANQLIRENNPIGNFTYVWAYDDAGNILSRTQYAYTTGTLGAAVDTLTYSYGNSTWGDLLTKVHSYTYYDAVGNPLNNDQRAYQWQHGRQLAKLAISSEFAIVSHPEDAACFASDRATFTVTAAGTGLSYQWQYKNGENWLDHTGEDATTSTISVDAAGNNGTAYRCVVTNAEGALLVSKPATLKHTTIRITSLSPDWWGPETGTAVFTVVAETTSSSLSYLWQWDNNGKWTNSGAAGATTDTIRVGASGDNWTTYRCNITDAEGNTVISDSVTIHTDSFGFTKQPEDCYCSPSGNATFSVETHGSNLTYQWQWHSPSSTSWSNSGATGTNTNAISLGVSGDNGTVYRCVITDANGNVAYSEPATVIPYAINWEYQYNADGMRIYRSNGAATYRYVYNGDQLSQMEISEEATEQKYLLTFSYDANGLPMTVDYDGEIYYYVTNLQGDVIAIADDSGNVKVEYTYDAWGNPLSISGSMASTLGKHNPLRYRGYVYDAETNLYYLQSRYYDAEVGRFISPEPNVFDGEFDDGAGLIGYNVYAYCANNPMSNIDLDGEAVANIVGGIVGGVAGAALGYLLAKQLGLTGWKKTALIAAATIGGAALGAFLGPYVAKLGSSVVAKLGIKSIPKLGSQIGRLGKLVKNTKPAIKGLTKHGLDRVAERGVSKSLLKSIVKSGHAISQSGGNTLFFTQKGVVVLNKAGKIVTAYSSKDFDSAMKQIIRQFYGG